MGSLTVVRVDGDAWLINGSTSGHLIKIVQTAVVEKREDENDGEQWQRLAKNQGPGRSVIVRDR